MPRVRPPLPRRDNTGEIPAISDTGPIPRVPGTGEIPVVHSTGEIPRQRGTGEIPVVRGGHPEHPEHPEHFGADGVWGGPPFGQPPRRAAPPEPRLGGPVRQDYLDAFADFTEPGYGAGVPAQPRGGPAESWSELYGDAGTGAGTGAGPGGFGLDTDSAPVPSHAPDPGLDTGLDPDPDLDPAPLHRREGPGHRRRNKGRYATGITAAAVTCALAAAIAGQVSDGKAKRAESAAAGGPERDRAGAASRSDDRPTPSASPGAQQAAALTYTQKMTRTYPLSRDLKGAGKLQPVAGGDKAPGSGRVIRYRVDVEADLPLDGKLFAAAVHKTLNDKRSWGGNGSLTFERVAPDADAKPEFVITLASPGTTDEWCAKSGLDTSDQDVSCDSAATNRVMINAYRWAQGAKTFGDDIHAYRQMLINHEVGHRLGHGHVGCPADGKLAPVMMQQTKYLSTDGATCKPNPWPLPRN